MTTENQKVKRVDLLNKFAGSVIMFVKLHFDPVLDGIDHDKNVFNV